MNCEVPASSRLEIKFVANPAHYHQLLQWLHLHRAGFFSPYPERRVNNIYFDTYDCFAYAENLSGASARTKVRYRWYGDSISPDPGNLEVKRKRNCHGWKLHFKVNEAPYMEGANWQTIKKMLQEQLSAEGKMWLTANPAPIIINRYLRKYLVSSDQRIRVTVDTQMNVWEQRFKSYPNFIHRANIPDVVVVEVKFDRIDYNIASQVIQGMPIRQSKHSKYVTGVRAISGI